MPRLPTVCLWKKFNLLLKRSVLEENRGRAVENPGHSWHGLPREKYSEGVEFHVGI